MRSKPSIYSQGRVIEQATILDPGTGTGMNAYTTSWRQYLAWHLGDESKITILANYGKVIGDKWLVTYRDDSPYTHDKSVCIKQAKQAFSDKSDKIPGQEHIIVFCGDGISDWSVTRKADILFARRGLDLEKYCRKHKIPFIVFDTFDKVTATVQGLTEGTLTVAEVNCRSECAN
ncbi:hypothetical protein BGZ52_010626 [Haplosporangium bisporale]|nr:hypothetical protein BGZ52_010626 [Haplosporangium bisporale]